MEYGRKSHSTPITSRSPDLPIVGLPADSLFREMLLLFLLDIDGAGKQSIAIQDVRRGWMVSLAWVKPDEFALPPVLVLPV
jgi:hypothetical protein